ncbi:MAG: FliH/SctL family protein [Verrucomicrobiia bacterium]|jgi:flagellar assembly protein FliH
MAQIVQLPHALRDVRSGLSPIALTETDLTERNAYNRGRQEGEDALREQLVAQRNEFLELHRGAIQSLRDAVPQVVRDSETALIVLAVEAAQRLIGGLPVSAEMVEAIVREALTQIEDTAEITVLLHADDLALLQKHTSPSSATAAGGPQVQYRSSPEVTRGGCLVQTRFGIVDGRRETKVELLKKTLVT